MKVSLWAEIRRLSEVEHLSQREIAQRLHCSRATVTQAVGLEEPPENARKKRCSKLDPYKEKIEVLIRRHPDLSAVRVCEEISQGAEGYRGSVQTVRRYLRKIRPPRRRVYQEVLYEPGQAMQVDWGHCGRVEIDGTVRKVSVFVAVLCYSRLCYIEFALSQRKAEFYRGIVHALEFFGGSPRRIIFDNLKAAVLNGSGRNACLHPEFLALCGQYCLEPVACARRDPESKGTVEAHVRYVKRNALAGRDDELTTWEDYQRLAVRWQDEVANVRQHQITGQRPVDRFESERGCLRELPGVRFDTDEIVPAVVNSHARVKFDGNRYSTPPEAAGQPVSVHAGTETVRILHQGREIARHPRCYGRGKLIQQDEHKIEALKTRRRTTGRQLEDAFDALGDVARRFHLKLRTRPVKTSRHVRRLLALVRLYGRGDVLAAMAQALEYQTYDAAYVESLVLQERRRRELPSPTELRPKRQELIEEIDLQDPDPADYDQFLRSDEDDEEDQRPST